MKALNEIYGFDHNDCKEVLQNEFKAAQNGETVVFGSLRDDQYQAVYDFFHSLLEKFGICKSMLDAIYQIAGAAHKASVDAGIAQIYQTYNTTELGGVHYSQIDDFLKSMTDWHQQWSAWAGN